MDNDTIRRYREEMLRMYGQRTAPAEEPAVPEVPEESPLDLPEPQEEEREEFGIEEDNPDVPKQTFPENSAEEANEDSDPDVGFDEPELPPYIQPVAPALPADWTAQEVYEGRNTAEGWLRVVAAAADSAYPIPGAQVTVFTRIGGRDYLNYMLTTDENGETPTVPLPAPEADLSQSPDNKSPYALCDIRIYAKGFFRSAAQNVHIFAGVTTRQVFQLVPLPTGMTAEDDLDPNPVGRTDEEVN